jgi:hypothetical protein
LNKNKKNQFERWDIKVSNQVAFSFAAALLLAIEHFNDKNPVVVPELAELSDCNVYIPDPEFVEARYDSEESIRRLWSAAEGEDKPCAILGALVEDITADLQSLLSALDMIMLVYFPEIDLTNPRISKTVVGMALNPLGLAQGVVRILQPREYLAVWHDKGDVFADELVNLGKDVNLKVNLFEHIPEPMGASWEQQTRQAFKRIKDSGILAVFLRSASTPALVNQTAGILQELDMFASKYVYILPETSVPPEFVKEIFGDAESWVPLRKLLSGAIVFDKLDGYEYQENDAFLNVWHSQNESLVDKMNALVPLHWLRAEPEYFQKAQPTRGASFLYDSVMTLAFGLCSGQKVQLDKALGNTTDSPVPSVAPRDVTPTSMPNGFRTLAPAVPVKEDFSNRTVDKEPSPVTQSTEQSPSLTPKMLPSQMPLKLSSPAAMLAPALLPTTPTPKTTAPLQETLATTLSPENPGVQPVSTAPEPTSKVQIMPAPNPAPSKAPIVHIPPVSAPAEPPALLPEPTSLPSSVPTSTFPTSSPIVAPISTPTAIVVPTTAPNTAPKTRLSAVPSTVPSTVATAPSTTEPSAVPPAAPNTEPSSLPSSAPSITPSSSPHLTPNTVLSSIPSAVPNTTPSSFPSSAPNTVPSSIPSAVPNTTPSSFPSSAPNTVPSSIPSAVPSTAPSYFPSLAPNTAPSSIPSGVPSTTPSSFPS